MTATLPRKRRTVSSKAPAVSPQQVQHLLLELAYRLHATKVVKRQATNGPVTPRPPIARATDFLSV